MPTGASQIFVEKTRQAAAILGITSGGAVSSVFTRTGAVIAAASDYDAVQIDNTPAGDVVATNAQAAIDELDGDKASAADLASTVNALGSSLVGVEDSGGNFSGTEAEAALTELTTGAATDADAIHDNVDGEIAAVALKAAPVGADVVLIEDSEATNSKKRVTAQSIADLASGGLVGEYVYARQEEAPATSGGTFTAGAFRTRVLNTLVVNDIGAGVSLAANEITLPAGTWRCEISMPSFGVAGNAGRLFNVTDVAVVPTLISATARSQTAANPCLMTGQFVLAASKALRIEHQCVTTTATNGFGILTSQPSGQTSVYTEAVFIRVAP